MKIKSTFSKFAKDIEHLELQKVTYFSSQASFYMVLSVFPFLILLITLSRFLPQSFGTMLSQIPPHILPETIKSFTQGLVEEARTNESSTLLITVSSITAIWSASKGTQSFIRGLDFFYGFDEKGNFIYKRIKACVLTLIFAVLVIASFAVLVIWEWLCEMILSLLNLQFSAVSGLLSYRLLLSLVALSIVFTLMYSFVPDKRTSIRSNLLGAVIASGGWIAFSAAFSLYVSHSSMTVYGSLTTIVLSMLWLYICISILFLGAIINKYTFLKRKEKK